MRMRALFCALGSAFAMALQGAALAQAWPEKPIRLIISYPPGGVHDAAARILQPKLAEAFGQPILIENRPGANGNIAAEAVARSAPDGYTFLVMGEGLGINRLVFRVVPFDYRDFVAVVKTADMPVALAVHPSVSANNMRELVELIRSKPGQFSYGSAGFAATGHLAGELLKSVTGIDMVHVPYKGGAPALADLLSGRIQLMFLSVALSKPQAQQGKLKIFAVVGQQRSPLMPEVPSTAEAGYPALEVPLFTGLFAPKQTPVPIVNRMNAEVRRILAMPEVRQRLLDVDAVPAPNTPEEFARLMSESVQYWGKLIREKGIRAD
jgi:tripartite-type tricarboxylate transporter receptor subunit TctC